MSDSDVVEAMAAAAREVGGCRASGGGLGFVGCRAPAAALPFLLCLVAVTVAALVLVGVWVVEVRK